MHSVALKAYAKVNLGLAVIGRREDGFHELRTIYQSISLADDVAVCLSPGPPGVRLESLGIAVPHGRENLAVRSAEAVLKELHLRRQVLVRLHKRIPAGSGLGGASSDAAAVMRALVYLTGKRPPPERLLCLAASLGSDVPFFLFGGRALGVGRGEEIYPVPEDPRRYCVVVFPGTGISTAEAYQQLHLPLLTRRSTDHNIGLFCGKTNAGRWNRLGNDFEQVVFAALPKLSGIKKALARRGAEMASLSGSGSAVFGIFADRAQAQRAAEHLQQPGYDVFLARTVSRREFRAQLPSLSSKP